MPKLIHYSIEPLKEIFDKEQARCPTTKPEGLWLSVEDGYGWKEWCTNENFALNRFEYETEITLEKNANILKLKNTRDIDEFTDEYWSNRDMEFETELRMAIKWNEVAAIYDGIIIAPYQWNRRLDTNTSWYYGWDCSSGCIWNSQVIKILEP